MSSQNLYEGQVGRHVIPRPCVPHLSRDVVLRPVLSSLMNRLSQEKSSGTIVLVDFDTVDESNLTRMVGSTPEDAESERKKTEVLQRLIQFINPKVNVVIAEGPWQNFGLTLRNCDIVMGCVDGYEVRDELERFCRRFLVPYIDIGMDVHKGVNGYGITGQVITSLPGGLCLRCLGLITDERLALEHQKYGAAGGRPQVIWPNGVLASTAVGQAISLLLPWNRMLPITPMIEYDGNRGVTWESNRLAFLKDKPCPHFESSTVGDPFFKISSCCHGQLPLSCD